MGKTGNQIDPIAIGALLKAQRQELGLSQASIAKTIGFKSTNFVSMLEKGRSPIPFGKIFDIVEAYKFDKIYYAVFIKWLYPEFWEAVRRLNKIALDENKTLDEIDDELEAHYVLALEYHGLNDFARMVESY